MLDLAQGHRYCGRRNVSTHQLSWWTWHRDTDTAVGGMSAHTSCHGGHGTGTQILRSAECQHAPAVVVDRAQGHRYCGRGNVSTRQLSCWTWHRDTDTAVGGMSARTSCHAGPGTGTQILRSSECQHAPAVMLDLAQGHRYCGPRNVSTHQLSCCTWHEDTVNVFVGMSADASCYAGPDTGIQIIFFELLISPIARKCESTQKKGLRLQIMKNHASNILCRIYSEVQH